MRKLFVATFITIAVGMPTFAQDDVAFAREIKARQSLMQVYAFNLGQLGAMAKGDAPYDAEQASNAANNLRAAATMKNGAMWPAGSDASAAGLADVTAAKPEIWSTYPEIADKGKALAEAATAMAAVAGDGLDSVRSNMGDLGNGCKGCHESFRISDD